MDGTPHRHDLAYVADLCRGHGLHLLQLGWSTHPSIGFDVAGIDWLDAYVEASRPNLADEYVAEFIELAASFYGESLIEAFGGRWAYSGDRLGVRIDEHRFTYPRALIARQVAGQAGTSVAVAFRLAIEHMDDEVAAA